MGKMLKPRKFENIWKEESAKASKVSNGAIL